MIPSETSSLCDAVCPETDVNIDSVLTVVNTGAVASTHQILTKIPDTRMQEGEEEREEVVTLERHRVCHVLGMDRGTQLKNKMHSCQVLQFLQKKRGKKTLKALTHRHLQIWCDLSR